MLYTSTRKMLHYEVRKYINQQQVLTVRCTERVVQKQGTLGSDI